MKPVSRSLHSYLTEYAARHPQRRLLGEPTGWLTAAQVLSRVEERAQQLRGCGGFVAVRAYRNVQTVIDILALQIVGAVAVLTDPRQECETYLRDSDIPVSAIIDGEKLRVLTAVKNAAKPDPKAPGFIIFTSGSTGKPKAVMLSQFNLVNNLLDSQPLGDYRADDIALGILPLDHVFGLVLLAGICVLGYALYLPEGKDVPAILSAIESEKITRMNGVPSLYMAMAEQCSSYDLSSLRAGFIGGGPWTPEQFRRMEARLGMTLIPVYGMSEFIGIACADYRSPQTVRAKGCAPFYSMNIGKILLPDGSEAAPGQTGEVCVDGPARMAGYFGDDSPREALLHTGDLGYLDEEGNLHLTGRKKDIIIRNGINLSPRRIEEAILSIPGVTEAAVVGLPDERAGELPWAMVVCDHSIDFPAELADRLHKNEIPAGIHIVEALPKTASGKKDMQTIREVLEQWKA